MPINPLNHLSFKVDPLHDPFLTEKPNPSILDCFEARHIQQPTQYEFLPLKDLYEQKDSLKSLNASQLIHFWNNVSAPKTSFFDRFNSKEPEEYYNEIVPKLCDEVTDRFLTGRELKSADNLHLLCILNNKLKSHIIHKVFEDDDNVLERYAKAKQSGIRLSAVEETQLLIPYIFNKTDKIIDRYQEAKHLKLRVDPDFAIDLFRSKNPKNIFNFFEQIRKRGIEHQHLFLMPKSGQNFLHQLFEEKIHSYESIAMFCMIAQKSGIDINPLFDQKNFVSKTPLQYTKNPSAFETILDKLIIETEQNIYNGLLIEFQIDTRLDVLQSYKQLLNKISPSHKLYQFFTSLDLIDILSNNGNLFEADLSVFSDIELLRNLPALKLYLHTRASNDTRIDQLYDEAEKAELTEVLALLKPHLPKLTPEIEYQRILKGVGVAEEFYNTKRGYRLAALRLHPDKVGAEGEDKFKRFMNLAEELGFK